MFVFKNAFCFIAEDTNNLSLQRVEKNELNDKIGLFQSLKLGLLQACLGSYHVQWLIFIGLGSAQSRKI